MPQGIDMSNSRLSESSTGVGARHGTVLVAGFVAASFCQFSRQSLPYASAGKHDKLRRNPCHSHSIVSGACKQLTFLHFFSPYAKLTVTCTAKNFRLGAIDGEKSRCISLLRQRAVESGVLQR